MRPFVKDVHAISILADTSIRNAIKIMDASTIGICIITGSDNEFLDIITDGDVRRAMLNELSFDASIKELHLLKRSIRQTSPITKDINESNDVLLQVMLELDLMHIPLLDQFGRAVDVALLSHLIEDKIPSVEAVVMAGGFGTRLRPLTENTPKPMLPVGNRPLMERTIEQLRASGVNDVNITTHYLPDQIIKHFGDGKDYGVKFNYIHEDKPLGTAGALKLIEKTAEHLLVVNGDILTNINYATMIEYHKNFKADLTIGVRKYEIDVPYGVVKTKNEKVKSLIEKPKYSFFVNAGIYLLNSSVVDHIPTNKRYDMTELIEKLVNNDYNVVSFPIREYWLDIGRIEDYAQAQEIVKRDFET